MDHLLLRVSYLKTSLSNSPVCMNEDKVLDPLATLFCLTVRVILLFQIKRISTIFLCPPRSALQVRESPCHPRWRRVTCSNAWLLLLPLFV